MVEREGDIKKKEGEVGGRRRGEEGRGGRGEEGGLGGEGEGEGGREGRGRALRASKLYNKIGGWMHYWVLTDG